MSTDLAIPDRPTPVRPLVDAVAVFLRATSGSSFHITFEQFRDARQDLKRALYFHLYSGQSADSTNLGRHAISACSQCTSTFPICDVGQAALDRDLQLSRQPRVVHHLCDGEISAIRTSGDARCTTCLLPHRLHDYCANSQLPDTGSIFPEYYLHVLCDGTHVKL